MENSITIFCQSIIRNIAENPIKSVSCVVLILFAYSSLMYKTGFSIGKAIYFATH